MEELADYIINGKDIRKNETLSKHADWVDEFLPNYSDVNSDNINDIIEKEVGKVFCQVLEDAGVYKCDEEGLKAFERFVNTL